MRLNELKTGQSATITQVGGEGALRQHFLDMGVIPGARITLVKYAPLGDPIEFRLHGYELTLRKDDAEKIEIEEATPSSSDMDGEPSDQTQEETQGNAKGKSQGTAKDSAASSLNNLYELPHPGLGEHMEVPGYRREHQNPQQGSLLFALVGNQNSGKSTLFNQLTGANQHVGNFPGVTVDMKRGTIKGHPEAEIVDLPGIYSLSPYTNEEVVSRSFVLEQNPSAIINIVDATNIQRNLYLTMQLMELDIPVVLALNMMDELEGNKGAIRINEMESFLGIPVVPISALKGHGIEELVDHAIHIARYDERPARTDFCSKDDNGGAVHRCIHGIMHLVEDHAERAAIPVRFAAGKLIEGDKIVENALDLTDNEKSSIEQIILQMEEERGLDRAAAMADMRFLFIDQLCRETVTRPRESREQIRSAALDRSLTGKYSAIPIFIGVMALTFWLTFNVIGAFLQGLVEEGIEELGEAVDDALVSGHVNEAIRSLIVDGVFNGVGSVVSFIPIIVVLFFFLSILEDSGYMARVAFVMDRLLRKIGLSGRSIVPMILGFGCTVPAVMATRTLPSERDRRLTILLTPFMSCSAKVPIYAFLSASLFPGKGGWMMIAMYFFGILVSILVALISRNTVYKGQAVPFVMELPNYRLPALSNVFRLMWDKAKDFLQRAFTVIFIGTLVIWFLQTFDFSLNMVEEGSQDSILAHLAGIISPLFIPLGIGTWQIVTALIAGFIAKESVVSVLSILYGGSAGITAAISPAAGISLMVFCLLYTPCMAAVAAIRREAGGRWALGLVLFQCAVAWVMALLVYQLASLAL